MDYVVKERQNFREPIEEAKEHEDRLVHSTIDHRSEVAVWWGSDKIKTWLARHGIVIGYRTVYRIICKYGLNRPLRKPRRRLRYIRWDRDRPNEPWQTDWKWVPWLKKWIMAFLDYYSRFIVGAGLYEEATAENALEVLREAVRRKDMGHRSGFLRTM